MTDPHAIDRDEIMALADGELGPERREIVTTHLAECEACRAYAAEIDRTRAALGAWQVAPAPASLDARVLADAARESRGGESGTGSIAGWLRGFGTWGLPRWSLAAASVAGLALVAIVAPRVWPDVPTPEAVLSEVRPEPGTRNDLASAPAASLPAAAGRQVTGGAAADPPRDSSTPVGLATSPGEARGPRAGAAVAESKRAGVKTGGDELARTASRETTKATAPAGMPAPPPPPSPVTAAEPPAGVVAGGLTPPGATAPIVAPPARGAPVGPAGATTVRPAGGAPPPPAATPPPPPAAPPPPGVADATAANRVAGGRGGRGGGVGRAGVDPSPRFASRAEQVVVAAQIERTARIRLAASRLDQARSALDRAVAAHGAEVASLVQPGPAPERPSIEATLRVPIGRLDALLADLRAIGGVDEEAVSSADLSVAVADLQARLAASRDQETRLRQIAGRSAAQDALAAAQQAARLRADIAQLEGEERSLRDRIARATVTLRITVREGGESRHQGRP